MMHILTLPFFVDNVDNRPCNTQLVVVKEDHDKKENMRLQIEAREKMQAELNKQEEQKKLEAKQAEQMALAAAKAVESLFAIPICHTCQSNRNALGLVTERKRNG